MQLGAESRKKTIVAISLMVLALIFVVVRFLPDSPGSGKVSHSGGDSRAGDAPEHCAQKWHRQESHDLERREFARSHSALRLAEGQRGYQVSGCGPEHLPG